MAHVVTTPDPPFLAAGGALRVHVFPMWQDNLAWVMECVATGEAAIIDAPDATLLAACAGRGLAPTTIFNTHTHPDHIGINRALARAGRLADFRVVGAEGVPGLTEPVDEGDVVRFGALSVQVWRTEGHLDGHLSYVVGDVVFCGDVMFAGGCGYLFDGPPAKMHASLERLAALPGETRVCCAHEYTQDNLRFAWSVEPDNAALADRIRAVWARRAEGRAAVPSTIAEERATNPFLRHHVAGLRARVAAALPERPLATAADVFAATRALKDTKAYKSAGEPAVLP